MQLDDFVQDTARGAGTIIKERFRGSYSRRSKGERGDVVTEVDERSEAYVIERIRRDYPDSRIVSEEAGILGSGAAQMTWVIDPLDGTRNFAEGIPLFCVSIGVLVGRSLEVGAIYDPIHDELFFAHRGEGAFCNGEPIRVSEETSIEDGIISLSWVRKMDLRQFLGYTEELCKHTSYFRRFGSAALALAYVACGRFHGYMQGGLNTWDVGGGVLLIQEAGGLVTDFSSRPINLASASIEILAANPTIHDRLLRDVIRASQPSSSPSS